MVEVISQRLGSCLTTLVWEDAQIFTTGSVLVLPVFVVRFVRPVAPLSFAAWLDVRLANLNPESCCNRFSEYFASSGLVEELFSPTFGFSCTKLWKL